MTIRKVRKKVDEIHKQLTPTIENVETITKQIQPALDKVDPLMERISLTVDAANLELMRVDQIMENTNVIVEGVAGATNAVGNIASAPGELINKAGKKIQSLIGGGNNNKGYIGELEEGDNVEQIVKKARHKGRRVARKSKNVVPENFEDDPFEQSPKKPAHTGNPYVSIN